MQTVAKKRYQKEPNRGKLTERDIAVTEALYRYRVLNTELIHRLLFENVGVQVVQRRLRYLFDIGFVERREPAEIINTRNPMASSLTYLLDKNGAEFLVAELGYEELRWNKKQNKAGFNHLRHLLGINRFRIEVELACELHDFTLEQWIDDYSLKLGYDKVQLRDGHKKISVAVIPDGFGKIQTPYHPQPSGFFLEYDTGSEQSKRIKHKAEAYISYFKSKAMVERFGIRNARVLFVTKGKRRRDNLQQYVESAIGRSDYISRFWFAVLEDAQADKVLSAPIWRVAGKETPAILFPKS